MAAVPLYPPSPTQVPEGFTAPSADYQARVVLVLVSLAFFFLLYLGLVIGMGVLTVLLLVSLRSVGSFLLAICSGLFFLFLIKGLFKRRQTVLAGRVAHLVKPGVLTKLTVPLVDCRADFSISPTKVPGNGDPRRLGIHFLSFEYAASR